MIRTALLIFRNEFRLLMRDRMSLFMLFMAPIIIIAVAGFSLGNMFGVNADSRQFLIPVVDRDHGKIAQAIIGGLARDSHLRLTDAADAPTARAIVAVNDDAPLAILIPPGTTRAFESGAAATIVVYVDPVKRVEASALELQLASLFREIAMAARAQSQARLDRASVDLQARIGRLAAQVDTLRFQAARFQSRMDKARTAMRTALEAQIRERLRLIAAQAQGAIAAALQARQAQLGAELARKQAAMRAVVAYLRQLRSSQSAFEQWLARLRSAAGAHAAAIPPPPQWPPPPGQRQLAELAAPIDVTPGSVGNAFAPQAANLRIVLPPMPAAPIPRIAIDPKALAVGAPPLLPGVIGWRDHALTPGYAEVNSFDQYVPGFGITFLLIDILWGVSVGLIDERDWGTLQRLRVSGAPMPGVLGGKLGARFMMGFVQMVVLLAVGRLLFGIRLGHSPLMLLLPTAAIAFAATAFGLVIAVVARTRDSVLPLGSVGAMTMSAIGGCWWPLNFEPGWMRAVAVWMPTTWTMRAYNDLMIRGLASERALFPALVTFGLGALLLGVGMLGAARGFD